MTKTSAMVSDVLTMTNGFESPMSTPLFLTESRAKPQSPSDRQGQMWNSIYAKQLTPATLPTDEDTMDRQRAGVLNCRCTLRANPHRHRWLARGFVCLASPQALSHRLSLSFFCLHAIVLGRHN